MARRKPSNPSVAKLRKSIHSKLTIWRRDPNRARKIPIEIRKDVIELIALGGNTTDVQALGISHEQAKKWQLDHVTTPISKATKPPSTTFVPVVKKPHSSISNADATLLQTTVSTQPSFILEYQRTDGARLKVYANSPAQATLLITQFMDN